MGLTGFPRVQFPRDSEETEKLVKGKPKRKKVLATHLVFVLRSPYDRAN